MCVQELGFNMCTGGVQGACPQQAVTGTGGMARACEGRAVGAGLKLVFYYIKTQWHSICKICKLT